MATPQRQSLVSLYTKVAMDADAAFALALRNAGMDRWETPQREWTAEVRAAYNAKVIADEHMHQAWTLWRS